MRMMLLEWGNQWRICEVGFGYERLTSEWITTDRYGFQINNACLTRDTRYWSPILAHHQSTSQQRPIALEICLGSACMMP